MSSQDRPSERVAQLRNGDPNVWTDVVRRHDVESDSLTVEDVSRERISAGGTRYYLFLTGHSDPLTVIGRPAIPHEINFHRQLGLDTPLLAPSCWFSHVDPVSREGWVVVDDVPHDRPAETWSSADITAILNDLASLHATYWGRSDLLLPHKWLPFLVGYDRMREATLPGVEPSENDWDRRRLTKQAVDSTGGLAPNWFEAAEGVRLMMEMGGWDGVVEEKHLRAAADLIDDPLPLLHRLRHQPITLLHGYPGSYNWRVTGLDARHLVDWSQVAIGPAVYDLVTWLETYGLVRDDKLLWRQRETWEMSEETMIDTWLIALKERLGKECETREVRRAIPAARCLSILLNWFPRFNRWLSQLPDNPSTRREIWETINQANDPVAQNVYQPIISLRPWLTETFTRFIRSYYQI